MCKLIVQINGLEPSEPVDVVPARKRCLVLVDADQVPPGAVNLWGRSLTITDAEPMPITAKPAPQTNAHLVRDLQACTDRILLDAPEGWKDAKVAAAELNLEYPAFMQRRRRHPPPPWIAHKNKITRKWKFDVPALRRWWAEQLVSGS